MASWRDDPVVGGKTESPPAPAGAAPAWQRDEVVAATAAKPPEQPESWNEYLSGLAGAVSHGATFGFADELKGAVQGGIAKVKGEDYGPAYEKARDEARAEAEQFHKRHPAQDFLAHLYGGGGTAVAGGAAAGATKLGMMAGRLAPEMAAMPPWLRTAAGWSAGGAAGGAVQGFGEGEGGLEQRAVNAANGAGTGALLGPPLGLAAKGIGMGLRTAGRALGFFKPENVGNNLQLRNLERDNLTPAAVSDRINAPEYAGAPMIVPDAAGRNTVNLASSVANMPGRGMDVAEKVADLRRAGGPERMGAARDAAFGGGGIGDANAARIGLEIERSTNAGPLYDIAHNASVADNPDLKRMLAMPEIQQGIQQGLTIQRMQAGATGQPQTYSGPELLDAAKQGLDTMLKSEKYTDKFGNLTKAGVALDELRRSFVAATDQAVPELAAARQAWAGPSQARDALEAGRTAFGKDSNDVVAANTGALSPADAPFLRLGAGESFGSKFTDPARVSGNARKMREDLGAQAKLGDILPGDAHDRLNRELEREMRIGRVNQAINPNANSQTARVLAATEDTAGGANALGEALHTGVTVGPGAAAMKLLQQALNRGRGLTPEVGEMLANRLFTTDRDAIHANMANLTRYQQARELDAQMRAQLANRLLLTTGAQGEHLRPR